MARQDRFASKAKTVLTAQGVQYPHSVITSCLTNDEIRSLVSDAQTLVNEKGSGVIILTGDRRAAAILKAKGISTFYADDRFFKSQKLVFCDTSQENL